MSGSEHLNLASWLAANPKPVIEPGASVEARRAFDRGLDEWLARKLRFEGFAEWLKHHPEPKLDDWIQALWRL